MRQSTSQSARFHNVAAVVTSRQPFFGVLVASATPNANGRDSGLLPPDYEAIFEQAGVALCVVDMRAAVAGYREARARQPSGDLTPEILHTLAAEVWIVAANKATAALLQLDDASIPARPGRTALLPSAFQTFARQLQEYAQGQPRLSAELEIQAPDGTVRRCETISVVPGEPPDLGRVVVSLTDVTRRHELAEQERKARMFLDAIIEHIPNMVFVKEAKGLTFALFNAAGERLIGVPRDQMYGKSDYDFFPKEQADFFTANDRKVFEQAEVLDIPEEPIDTAEGERWLHTQKVPLFDERGQPEFLLGISQDITERRRVRETLRARTRELERSNADLQQFAYVASHDLNEPLRTIAGFTELIVEELGDDLSTEMQQYVSFLVGGVERMREMLAALLELSRVGNRPFEVQDVPLNELANEVMAMLAAAVEEANATFSLEELPTIRTDRVLLSRVLQNLFANALKFRADAPPDIQVTWKEKGGGVELAVRDNGIGFDPKFHDRMFQPFRRLHSKARFKGAGMGLAICHRIVTDLGGRIWAQANEGDGATFSVWLPRIPPKGSRFASSSPG